MYWLLVISLWFEDENPTTIWHSSSNTSTAHNNQSSNLARSLNIQQPQTYTHTQREQETDRVISRAWQRLRKYLLKFDTVDTNFSYRVSVCETILLADNRLHVPQWLIDLFRVLYSHKHVFRCLYVYVCLYIFLAKGTQSYVLYGCMCVRVLYVCMCVCMYVCMYVCVCAKLTVLMLFVDVC